MSKGKSKGKLMLTIPSHESENVRGVFIARTLVNENDPEMKKRYSHTREYTIVHSLEDQPTNLEFSKSLSVDDISHLLVRFIDELQREGFDTPNAQIQVVPTDKEGEFKVPDNFSPSKS
jgi:hypothetical protein